MERDGPAAATRSREMNLAIVLGSRFIEGLALEARNNANLFRPVGAKDFLGVGDPRVAEAATLG